MGRQKIIGVILGSIREGRVNDRVARWVTGQLERHGFATRLIDPADPGLLARRYRDADDYLARYRSATEQMIDSGFALAADRDEILADARPDLVPSRSAVG